MCEENLWNVGNAWERLDEVYNSLPPPRTPSYSNKEGTLLSQMYFLVVLPYLIQNANTSQIPTRPSPRGTKWGLVGKTMQLECLFSSFTNTDACFSVPHVSHRATIHTAAFRRSFQISHITKKYIMKCQYLS